MGVSLVDVVAKDDQCHQHQGEASEPELKRQHDDGNIADGKNVDAVAVGSSKEGLGNAPILQVEPNDQNHADDEGSNGDTGEQRWVIDPFTLHRGESAQNAQYS